MAAANFPAVISFVLSHEGGYVNHPQDPGGATNRGITIATFRAWRNDFRATVGELRAMTEEEARQIYRVEYWNATRCDDLRGGVDAMVMDMAVNAGVRRSALQLQTAAGMAGADLDGAIGPRTLAAANSQDPVRLIAALGEFHERHYRGLAHFPTFGRGWMNRLTGRLELAHRLHGATTTATA